MQTAFDTVVCPFRFHKISMNILVGEGHGSREIPKKPECVGYDRPGRTDFGEYPLTTETRKDTEMEDLHYAEESKDSINLGCFRAFPSVQWLKNSFPMDPSNVERIDSMERRVAGAETGSRSARALGARRRSVLRWLATSLPLLAVLLVGLDRLSSVTSLPLGILLFSVWAWAAFLRPWPRRLPAGT